MGSGTSKKQDTKVIKTTPKPVSGRTPKHVEKEATPRATRTPGAGLASSGGRPTPHAPPGAPDNPGRHPTAAATQYAGDIRKQWQKAKALCGAAVAPPCPQTHPPMARVYVASTRPDFKWERQWLDTQVFPELHQWCISRQIELIISDMHLDQDAQDPPGADLCLGEAERCAAGWVVALLGEGAGRPLRREEAAPGRDWAQGLTALEAELLLTAFNNQHPKESLFLARKPDFLAEIPSQFRPVFCRPDDAQTAARVDVIHEMARKHSGEVVWYDVVYEGINPLAMDMQLSVRDPDKLRERILSFLKKRISERFPDLPEACIYNPIRQCPTSLPVLIGKLHGRDSSVQQVTKYLQTPGGRPMLLTGSFGCGKTSIISRALTAFNSNGESKGMFYCDAGSSQDVFLFMRCVLSSVEYPVGATRLPQPQTDNKTLCAHFRSALCTDTPTRLLVVIDSIDRLAGAELQAVVAGIPGRLGAGVRIVLVGSADTPAVTAVLNAPQPHIGHTLGITQTQSRSEPQPETEEQDTGGQRRDLFVLEVDPLSEEYRSGVVQTAVTPLCPAGLTDPQTAALLRHRGAGSAAWLAAAGRLVAHCRALGRDLGPAEIQRLKDNPVSLVVAHLDVLMQPVGPGAAQALPRCVAALCALATARRGMTEGELRRLLAAHPAHLLPRGAPLSPPTTPRDTRQTDAAGGAVASRVWAAVWVLIAPLVRTTPDGLLTLAGSTEHKAVMKRLLSKHGGRDLQQMHHWHKQLADLWDSPDARLVRRLQELPYHAEAIKDRARLERHLVNWSVVAACRQEAGVHDLLSWWQKVSNLARAADAYEAVVRAGDQGGEGGVGPILRHQLAARLVCECGEARRAADLLRVICAPTPDIHVLMAYCTEQTVTSLLHNVTSEPLSAAECTRLRDVIQKYQDSLSELKESDDKVLEGECACRMAQYSGRLERGGGALQDGTSPAPTARTAATQAASLLRGTNSTVSLIIGLLIQAQYGEHGRDEVIQEAASVMRARLSPAHPTYMWADQQVHTLQQEPETQQTLADGY